MQLHLYPNMILQSTDGHTRIKLLFPGNLGWYYIFTSFLGWKSTNNWCEYPHPGMQFSDDFNDWSFVSVDRYSDWERREFVNEISRRETERLSLTLPDKSWLIRTNKCQFISHIIGVVYVRQKLIMVCEKARCHELQIGMAFIEDTGQFIRPSSCLGLGPQMAV